jgi:hypothetical protein
MEESMIDRVASAICEARNAWFARDLEGDQPDYNEVVARAAIKAMREPTPEMVRAGVEGWKANGLASIQFVWPSMIDAALHSEG